MQLRSLLSVLLAVAVAAAVSAQPCLDVELVPAGLHASLSLISAAPCSFNCQVYVLVEVSQTLIVDRFQLRRELLTPTSMVHSLDIRGETDIEAPSYRAGSAQVLLGLDRSALANGTLSLQVPLHARYQEPASEQEQARTRPASLPVPKLVLLCGSARGSDKGCGKLLSGAEGFFPLETPCLLEHAIQPRGPMTMLVPVGIAADLTWVELTTTAVAWLLAVVLVATIVRSQTMRTVSTSAAKKD